MTSLPVPSSDRVPTQAMVLAAGLGTRMRPLTERVPKPLLSLGGRPLLDHALDQLARAGVRRVVVNAHWQAALLKRHLDERRALSQTQLPETVVVEEPALLDTGGAVRNALQQGLLRPEPFYVLNGDAFWLDGPRQALLRLVDIVAQTTDGLDAVLLVHPTHLVHAEVGLGDFAVDEMGGVRRRLEGEVVPYVYAGVQLVTPALFRDAPDGAFSTNILWDRAIEQGRVRAAVHDGLWFHLSTPKDLSEAEYLLGARTTGESR